MPRLVLCWDLNGFLVSGSDLASPKKQCSFRTRRYTSIRCLLIALLFRHVCFFPKRGSALTTELTIFKRIYNTVSNLDEISGEEWVAPMEHKTNVLHRHLERGKKLLLKFNINLARLWVELEEQSAAQCKSLGWERCDFSWCSWSKENNGQLISDSKGYLGPSLATA